MTELSVQEKLLKLQAMGKMPSDNTPSLGEYLQLAMELAECKTKLLEVDKLIQEVCKQCGEKDLPDGCQNDCWYADLEKVLGKAILSRNQINSKKESDKVTP